MTFDPVFIAPHHEFNDVFWDESAGREARLEPAAADKRRRSDTTA